VRRHGALAFAFGAGAASVIACGSGPVVTYAGREHDRAVDPSKIAIVAGRLPPEGYTILGVVTARCTTVDGASGLLAERCDDDTMTEALRRRAASAGATALLDLRCERVVTDRHTERGDAGAVVVKVRQELSCQGTALRHEGRRPVATDEAPRGRRVTIGGVELVVEVTLEPGAATDAGRPRSPDEVPELDVFPNGYNRLARVSATCLAGCARNAPRLAIRDASAEIGAVAFAELRCDLDGDRWLCEAIAVGE
jgi:hypothetical protein